MLETEITHFVNINISGLILPELELTLAQGINMDSRLDCLHAWKSEATFQGPSALQRLLVLKQRNFCSLPLKSVLKKPH